MQAVCHPDKVHFGRGYCRACYGRWWRKENPDKTKAAYQRRYARGGHHKYELWSKYRIRPDEYERLLLEQNNVCAVCGRQCDCKICEKKQRLSVDHDHVTGQVRGLLCHKCNMAIGGLQDSPELLRAAADYLESNKRNS